MGKTSDLSDFERGMIVGANRGESSISKTGFHARQSLLRMVRQTKKHPVSGSPMGDNSEFMIEVKGECQEVKFVIKEL